LSELGLEGSFVTRSMTLRLPITVELENGLDTTVVARCVPLVEGGRTSGAVVLTRDISELRSRDRLLKSKDATIREIHHRVKNNLQTIAALLRLQGRRLESEEARDAVAESERRVRSMAIVHETLARDMGDVVSFSDVVQPLVRVVEETVSTPELRLRFEVDGDAGELPGEVATPLAVVLNELMQNAVDHAFPRAADGPTEGRVRIHLARAADELVVDVVDDGVGLPPGFSLDERKGLGLSIVHALVTGELNGTIELRDDRGTCVHVRLPVRRQERVEP
jgi:two-component sensor histidine kinase